jgi:hypothetical protein
MWNLVHGTVTSQPLEAAREPHPEICALAWSRVVRAVEKIIVLLPSGYGKLYSGLLVALTLSSTSRAGVRFGQPCMRSMPTTMCVLHTISSVRTAALV